MNIERETSFTNAAAMPPTSQIEYEAWDNVYKIYQKCKPGRTLYNIALELSKNNNLTEDRRMMQQLRELRHKFPEIYYDDLMKRQQYCTSEILKYMDVYESERKTATKKELAKIMSKIRSYSIRAVIILHDFKDRFNLKMVNGILEFGATKSSLSKTTSMTTDGSEFNI